MKKLRKWLIIVAATILVCLVIGGIWYYLHIKAQEELGKWKSIEQSHSISQIQNYIIDNPDSDYLDQAKRRLEYVKEDVETWNQARDI